MAERINPELSGNIANSLEIMQNILYLLSESAPLTGEQVRYVAALVAEHERLTELYQEVRASE